ncbi:MAG: hypothetical protein MPJ22_00625 [Pirellulales bacterium]|nr:hypothetical protein [Alphaproteobacteria bacterium]MDA8030053.1 hypothetical protein [Alphaproteobacteria bacterium]MDA8040913.1 hypothetical protein [Pirellulales bacterium]
MPDTQRNSQKWIMPDTNIWVLYYGIEEEGLDENTENTITGAIENMEIRIDKIVYGEFIVHIGNKIKRMIQNHGYDWNDDHENEIFSLAKMVEEFSELAANKKVGIRHDEIKTKWIDMRDKAKRVHDYVQSVRDADTTNNTTVIDDNTREKKVFLGNADQGILASAAGLTHSRKILLVTRDRDFTDFEEKIHTTFNVNLEIEKPGISDAKTNGKDTKPPVKNPNLIIHRDVLILYCDLGVEKLNPDWKEFIDDAKNCDCLGIDGATYGAILERIGKSIISMTLGVGTNGLVRNRGYKRQTIDGFVYYLAKKIKELTELYIKCRIDQKIIKNNWTDTYKIVAELLEDIMPSENRKIHPEHITSITTAVALEDLQKNGMEFLTKFKLLVINNKKINEKTMVNLKIKKIKWSGFATIEVDSEDDFDGYYDNTLYEEVF